MPTSDHFPLTLKESVSALISVVDNASPSFHGLYSEFTSSTLSSEIRLLDQLPDHLVLTFLSGKTGDHSIELLPYFDNLTLLRSFVAHFCLAFRVKNSILHHSLDTRILSDFMLNGYVSITDFLPQDIFASLSSNLSVGLFKSPDSSSDWHHQLSNILSRSPLHFGTAFIDYSFPELSILNRLVQNLVSELTSSSLPQPSRGMVAKVNHYTHDPVTLFHYDNDGVTSIKWFYFPFGTSSLDSGFLYAPKSHLLSHARAKLLFHMNECYKTGQTVSNLRPEEIEHLYSISSFNAPNTLVVANTAGFHARAAAPSGTERITIQGGTDNSIAFSLV